MVNAAVLIPTPKASVTKAATAEPGLLSNRRKASFTAVVRVKRRRNLGIPNAA